MLKLYNTLTRKKEEFRALEDKKVGIYSCGPTVYWNQHIGNMYAYVQWDVLVRFLRYLGYKVKWVMNITDVGHMTSDQDQGEDKMEKGAKREGLSVWQIAEKYIKQFKESMDLLNIQSPDVLCRATEHIKEQIDLIKKIEKNGFAYKTKTGLVFDTSKFKDYPKFARLNLKKQTAGARVEIDPEKKKPWDFLLWVTNQPKHIMRWQSPWSAGFPGWHIECTAMSTKYLGERFDIHTGGKEHIPVHHTNEIAQAFGAFGKQTANYWLHNEWLLIDDTKVSKSLGNIVLVTDLIERRVDPLAFRYLVLTSHYRQGLNFTWKGLEASQKAILRLRNIASELKDDKKINKEYLDKFEKTLANDLDTARSLAVLWDLLRNRNAKGKARAIKEMDGVLGLNLFKKERIKIPAEIKKLAKEREKARKNKNWQKADEIRKEVESRGYFIEDTSKGPKIKRG